MTPVLRSIPELQGLDVLPGGDGPRQLASRLPGRESSENNSTFQAVS